MSSDNDGNKPDINNRRYLKNPQIFENKQHTFKSTIGQIKFFKRTFKIF